MVTINTNTADESTRAFDQSNIPKAIQQCHDTLRKGNRPLRQLSNYAKAIAMWHDINEWDEEKQ